MQKYIEPFVKQPIASWQTEEDTTSYYSELGELLAEEYFHEEEVYSATFYGTSELQTTITQEQVDQIVKKVQTVFEQEQLAMELMVQREDAFYVVLQTLEPVYKVPSPGTVMTITISLTGFVEEVTLKENDVTIHYSDQLISKEEARAILQQQPILTLGIAPELGWQYVYKQNYDLFGIKPDGRVYLWSESELMQDASFEPLPKVEDIADFEGFLKGNRKATVEMINEEGEKSWVIDSDDYVQLEEDVFLRACKVMKHLVGEAYENYFVEQYPTLKKFLAFEDDAYVRFRFVYIYNNISFDLQAITISVNTETNQIESVTYPFIPHETFPTLPTPTLTLDEANQIAQQLIDVELGLECDLEDRKSYSFYYSMDYPSSPTGGHIQYVDAFTGKIHWIDTGW